MKGDFQRLKIERNKRAGTMWQLDVKYDWW